MVPQKKIREIEYGLELQCNGAAWNVIINPRFGSQRWSICRQKTEKLVRAETEKQEKCVYLPMS